jgi:hypothetical protein
VWRKQVEQVSAAPGGALALERVNPGLKSGAIVRSSLRDLGERGVSLSVSASSSARWRGRSRAGGFGIFYCGDGVEGEG